MVKFKNNARVKITGTFFANSVSTTPIYWYSTGSTDWFNTSNWYSDSAHTTAVNRSPLTTEAVYLVANSVRPIANIGGGNSWVNPNSINVGTIGMGLSSANPVTVATNFRGTGTVAVSGRVTIDDPT